MSGDPAGQEKRSDPQGCSAPVHNQREALMKRRGWFVPGLGVYQAVLFLSVISLIFLSTLPLAAQMGQPKARQITTTLAKLPLQFEVNKGQAPGKVKFLARGPAYNLALTNDEAALFLQKTQPRQEGRGGSWKEAARGNGGSPDVLRVRFEHANPATLVSGEDGLPGDSNYFIGNDPKKWRANLSNYARVRYRDIYPGIDLVYYGNQGRLEYDFVIAPGARPQDIGLKIEGADRVELDAAGDLILRIGDRAVRLQKPLVYQEIQGRRQEIAGGYLLDKGRVSFRLADYDRNQPLVIDPVLSFSTYFGGSGDELFIFGNIDGAIAVDGVTGNIFVAGETLSTSFAFGAFPAGGFDQGCGTDTPPTCNSTAPGGPYPDVFIAKLNPTASAVLAFTYLGGSSEDHAYSLVVDATGVYVSGTTFSNDFPTTAGVFRATCPSTTPACANAGDGFVTKLDLNLSLLLFSTYLSGNGTAQAGQMQVDGAGNVYVAGQAEAGYPTTTGAFQTACSTPNCARGFITELDNAGRTQVFSTFLGGSGNDAIAALVLDSNHNVYVSGSTTSADFPTTAGVVQPSPTNGGLYTTANSGGSWTALNNGFVTGAGLPTRNILAVAIRPGTPTTLLAGTDQGIFISTNSGAQWNFAGTSTGLNVVSLAFDPVNPQNVYAATQGSGTGVFKSTDGGNTWAPSNGAGSTGLPTNNHHTIACDPRTSGTVYVGTAGSGLYKSVDGGASWVAANNGLTAGDITAVAIDPVTASNVYVGTRQKGVYVSTNAGGNWVQMNTGLVGNTGTPPRIDALAVDPVNRSNIYAGTVDGLFKTTNSAASWTPINSGLAVGTPGSGPNLRVEAIAIDPANSQNIYVGTRAWGVFHTTNGGAAWTAASTGMSRTVLSLALQNSTTLFAGTFLRTGFVAKLNAGGASLGYSTFLGGNARTFLAGIGLDSSNNVYVDGQSDATNFPVSATAFQRNLLGVSNAVVAKLNSTGTSLTYATYVGGSGADGAYSLVVDGSQNAWLTGFTSSDDFPLANGVWLNSPGNGGNNKEAFVTQVNPTGSGLLFSTYLGGRSGLVGPADSEGVGIMLDATGNAYVIGFTNNNDFPTASALQPAPGGGYDAFIAKIAASTTVTDLSICAVDTTGNCTTTPPPPVVAGTDLVFNLLVTNKSTTTAATGVVVGGRGGNGIRPIGCTVSVGTCFVDNSPTPSTIPNGGFASLGTLAPGATAQIRITLRPIQAGTFAVSVDVRENETDANPADNSASTTITVLPGADIAVALSESPTPAQVGSTLTYTATVANLGPSPASNVTASLTFVPATAVTVVNPPPQCTTINPGVLNCALGPMNVGPSGAGTITVTVNSLPITTTLTASNTPEADPDPTNNSATVSTSSVERFLITDWDNDVLRVFNLADNSVATAPIRVGRTPAGVAVSPNRRLAFVGNVNSNYSSVVDLTIGREIARIHDVQADRNVAISRDGTLVVIPDLRTNELVVIDGTTFNILQRVPVAQVLGNPTGSDLLGSVVILGDNLALANINSFQSNLPLVVLDLVGYRIESVGGLSGSGVNTSGIAATPDGSNVLVLRRNPNNLYIFNTATLSLGSTIALPDLPYAITAIPSPTSSNLTFGFLAHAGVNGTTISAIDMRPGSATFGQLLPGTDVVLSTFSSVRTVASNSDGSRLLVTSTFNGGGDNVAVLDITPVRGCSNTPSACAPPVVLSHTRLGDTQSSFTGAVVAFADTVPPATVPVLSSPVTPSTVLYGTGTPVEITGSNLGSDPVVRFGNEDPVPGTATATIVTAIPALEAAAGTDDIIVTVRNATSPVEQQNQSALLTGALQIMPPFNFHPLNQVVVADTGGDEVDVLDLHNKDFTRLPVSAGVGDRPLSVAITADGQRAYTTSFAPGNVDFFNLSTSPPAQEVPSLALLGPNGTSGKQFGQNDAIVSTVYPPSGEAVMVALSTVRTPSPLDQISVIGADPTNTAHFKQAFATFTVAAPPGSTTGGLGSTPDGRFLYANDNSGSTGNLVIFDLSAAPTVNTTVLPLANLGNASVTLNPFQSSVYLTPDGNALLLTTNQGGIAVYDISGTYVTGATRTNPLLIATTTGTPPAGFTAVFPNSYKVLGSQLFAFDSFDSIVQMFSYNPAGRSFALEQSFVIPGQTGNLDADLTVSPDGSLIYVVLEGQDQVLVLDANAMLAGAVNPIITRLATGVNPLGVAISPLTVGEPDLVLSMTGTTAANLGGSITYNISLTNLRPTTANNVVLASVISPTVTISSISASQGSCTQTPVPPNSTVINCNLGNVAQSQVLTITAVAAVPSSGMACPASPVGCVTNVATAVEDPSQIDYNPVDNTSFVTTQIGNLPDLQVQVVPSPVPPIANAPFGYTVTLTNAGGPATNVALDTTFSGTTGFTISSAGIDVGSCTTGATIHCTIGSMASGAVVHFNFSGIPGSAGTLTVTVAATETGTDANPADNTNSQTFTVGAPVVDLAVAMTASPSSVPVLGNVNYQITVTNNGPSAATGIVLTDALPAATVFARIDDLTDCAVSGGTLTCHFASLAVGSASARTLNLILVPLAVPAAPGTFPNSVTVVANENPTGANMIQTVTVTPTTPPGGSAFRNLPGFATNVLGPNDDSSTGLVPVGFSLNFVGVQVSSLYVNNNGNVTLDSALSTFTPFDLTSTSRVIIAPYFSDVDTGGVGSGLVTYGRDTVNGHPAFGVNWPNVEYFPSSDPTKLNIFQLVLVDRSDLGAGNFDIEFNYDKIQWETGDASGGTNGLGGSSARVGYSNGSQTAGSFFELPGSGVPGSFLDSNPTTGLIFGELNSTQPGRYIFPVRGGAVQSSADLGITASGPANANAGDTVTYTMVATNLGPNTATGVTVTNTLPLGFTFVSATPSNICPAPAAPPAGQPVVVVCNVGSLASGTNVTITVQAAIPSNFSGAGTDKAVVSVPNNQDLNLANNTALVPTSVASADLAVTVALVPPSSASSSTISYVLTLTNNGPSAATTVDMTDVIAGAAAFASPPTSTAMSCALVTATSADCQMATLNAGSSAIVNVTVNLTGAGWTSNDVHAQSTVHDPNPLNNSVHVQKAQAGGNTAIGLDVAVQPVDSTTGASPAVVTFSSVTTSGTTSLASSATGPVPPSGFRTGTPAVFYNLSTTAGYSGTIGITLTFNGVTFHHPANVRLFHYENGTWVDRTVAVNAAGGYAVGVVTSLSPFALFEPVNKVPVANAGADRTMPGSSPQGTKVILDGSASFDPDNDALTYRWTGPFPEGNGTVTGVSASVTMPLGVGHVTLVVNDGEVDSAPAGQAITVTDFAMSEAAAGSTTIAAGASVAFNISALPQFGPFTSAVTLGCVGLPQGMRCSFSSGAVTPGGAPATLTIATTPRTGAQLAPLGSRAPLYALWIPLPAIALLGAGTRKRSRKRWLTVLLLVMLMSGLTLLLVSCGGGGVGAVATPAGTAPGNYSITVQGTANGGLQHSTTVNFTVQ